MTKRLVLASASPRRHELLASIGVAHEVILPGAEEPAVSSRSAESHVGESAAWKAGRVAAACPGRLVLGADTLVAAPDGAPLGKPANRDEARAMLRRLSARAHDVWSGVALARDGAVEVAAACTRVRFAPLSDELVARYVATGEPDDKAGAYAIQGRLAPHVTGIEGSWANVVGLPLEILPALFERAGERLADWQDW